jgi:hypothetical protein
MSPALPDALFYTADWTGSERVRQWLNWQKRLSYLTLRHTLNKKRDLY